MDGQNLQLEPIYHRIYLVVRQIPRGKVATYGQIAVIVGGCTARMVGYALSATPQQSDVPWQRVINAQGKISETELQILQLDNDRQQEITKELREVQAKLFEATERLGMLED